MVSSQGKNCKQKEIAEESLKTKKAREKLRRRLAVVDAQITKEGIHKKSVEIHRWISRHTDDRIVLQEKSISLFDENQNAAKASEGISKLVEDL